MHIVGVVTEVVKVELVPDRVEVGREPLRTAEDHRDVFPVALVVVHPLVERTVRPAPISVAEHLLVRVALCTAQQQVTHVDAVDQVVKQRILHENGDLFEYSSIMNQALEIASRENMD